MSMFTRNDKTPEANPGAPMPAREKAEAAPPVPAYAEPGRQQQASAQPIAPAPAAQPASVSVSVISKALKITGQLESTEDIQIEGQVDGDVHAASVKVGSNAKVKGTVYGDVVELAGSIDGRIEARKVVLTSTAHMSGDVIHQDITIQSGAFIDGHCKPEFGKADSAKSIPVFKPASTTREQTADRPNGSASTAASTGATAARP